MTAEALAFALGVLIFLTLIGLGLTELMLPQAEGFSPLVAPAVGLAVSAIAFQWLSFLLPPFLVAVIVLIAFGSLSLVIAWRRRANLFGRKYDLLAATAATLTFYIAILQIVIQRGFFTLGGLASDNVFIYTQAAQYLRDHPIPSALHPLTLHNPQSFYFVSSGVTAFPNSVGQIDAASSVLSGWPVYAVFDPLSSLCVALAIGPLWFLVRVGLGGSSWTAAAAAAVLATNQLTYWLVGSGFQQEAEALPVLLAALVLTMHAWRTESSSAGGLAGIVAGALPGLYLPMAALFAICALGSLVAHAVAGPIAHRLRLLRPLGSATAAGVGCAAMAIYILMFHGGLATWFAIVNARVPAGGVSSFPPFPYLFGALPFAHVWEQTLRPLTPFEGAAIPLLFVASIGLVVLLLVGVLGAIVQRRVPEAAIVAAGMLFVAYELAIARYPYGYVKSFGYLAPLTSAFVAFGAVGMESLVKSTARSTFVRFAGPVGILVLCFVVAASALASREMVQTWLIGGPTFTRPLLSLASLSSKVPAGSKVFVDYPADEYTSLVKVGAIAYFLPDREVRIFTGDVRLGTFPEQNVRPQTCHFDYVIATSPPDADFALVYTETDAGLSVYKREGPACG